MAVGVLNSFCELKTTFMAGNHFRALHKHDIKFKKMSGLERTKLLEVNWLVFV